MEFSLYPTSYERSRGDLPSLPLINLFAEPGYKEEEINLQSRPGLSQKSTLGDGPIRALHSASGVFAGSLFTVSGNEVYRGTTLLGTIESSGHVSIASLPNLLFITAGASLYRYDGYTFELVPFPDNASVLKICTGASRLIAIREDSQMFYWSDPLSENIDGLSFASSENSPDILLDALFKGDLLILFGAETVEFWPVSGVDDPPFVPLQGRVFSKGIKTTGAAVLTGSSFVWVTNTNQVCIDTPDDIVSFKELEAKIEASSVAKLWTFYLDNTELVALTLNTETWILNPITRLWSQFASYGEDNWEPVCYADDTFGSGLSGRLIEWAGNYSDFNGSLERRFRVWAPLSGEALIAYNILLRINLGQTPYLTGALANPLIQMRMSKDGGFTWGPWKDRHLGEQGNYRKRATWRSLGMFGYPGAMLEFRIADPVPFRATSLSLNSKYEGR